MEVLLPSSLITAQINRPSGPGGSVERDAARLYREAAAESRNQTSEASEPRDFPVDRVEIRNRTEQDGARKEAVETRRAEKQRQAPEAGKKEARAAEQPSRREAPRAHVQKRSEPPGSRVDIRV